jgi:repressor LexA
VKRYSARGGSITLTPANSSMKPMVFDESEVSIYGRVVTVMRRL